MTAYEIRLKCAEIAVNGCARHGIERLNALPLAEKIYEFVTATPSESVSQDKTSSRIKNSGSETISK
jgi:hypothetical protein